MCRFLRVANVFFTVVVFVRIWTVCGDSVYNNNHNTFSHKNKVEKNKVKTLQRKTKKQRIHSLHQPNKKEDTQKETQPKNMVSSSKMVGDATDSFIFFSFVSFCFVHFADEIQKCNVLSVSFVVIAVAVVHCTSEPHNKKSFVFFFGFWIELCMERRSEQYGKKKSETNYAKGEKAML